MLQQDELQKHYVTWKNSATKDHIFIVTESRLMVTWELE